MTPSSLVERAAANFATAPFWKQNCIIWSVAFCFAVPTRIQATGDISAGLSSALLSQVFACLLTLALQRLYLALLQRHMTLAVIFIAVTFSYLGSLCDVMLTKALLGHFENQDPLQTFDVFLLTRFRIYLLWTAVYCAFNYRQFALSSERDVARQKADNLALEALVREAQIRMLRAQVSPHFLFNALTVAIADLKRRPDVVREMLSAMADYFRYAQINRDRSLVPIGEEYEAILQYLIVQKACLRDHLIVQTYICDSAREFLVPGLILQPLVENALQHGQRTDDIPLQIMIDIRRAGDGLRISVANSGNWLEQKASRNASEAGGSGLSNLRNRLTLCYGETANLTIDAEGDLVDVIIDLPLRGGLVAERPA